MAQLHVLQKIGAGLHHARGNSGGLELGHHFFRAPRLRPLLRDGVKFRAVLQRV